MEKISLYRPFVLMVLVSVIIIPLYEISMRNLITHHLDLVMTGEWQATNRLSAAYVSIFGSYLTFYFLPSIQNMSTHKELDQHIIKTMLNLTLIYGLVLGVFYLGRDIFIPLFLSNEFKNISAIIHYQIIGDYFRVLSFVFGFYIISKSLTKLYVAGELIQYGLLIFISIAQFSVNKNLVGIYQAYLYSIIIYFILILSVYTFYLRKRV